MRRLPCRRARRRNGRGPRGRLGRPVWARSPQRATRLPGLRAPLSPPLAPPTSLRGAMQGMSLVTCRSAHATCHALRAGIGARRLLLAFPSCVNRDVLWPHQIKVDTTLSFSSSSPLPPSHPVRRLPTPGRLFSAKPLPGAPPSWPSSHVRVLTSAVRARQAPSHPLAAPCAGGRRSAPVLAVTLAHLWLKANHRPVAQAAAQTSACRMREVTSVQ